MANKILFGLLFLTLIISLIIFFISKPKSETENYNIILISIDTLRADHLGFYGYERPTSPNIDNFAKKSIVFENAISQAVWTLPSHVSLFTSKYGFEHNVKTRNDRIGHEDVTLAEVLQDNGYKTVAFVGSNKSGSDVESIFGFSDGFKIYYENGLFYDTTIPSATNWLKNNFDGKFFLFLHGYDVHDPYHKPEPYENFFDPTYEGFVDKLYLITSPVSGDIPKIKKQGDNYIYENDSEITVLSQADINHIIAHYDGNILYTDFLFRQFFADLESLGTFNNTIIVIFGDHGETIGEHVSDDGRILGHDDPYDEVIHVPLIIWHPLYEHKVIKKQAQLIDIMPTLLDFVKVDNPEGIQGRSLVPLIENSTDVNPYAFSEGFAGSKQAVRTLKWKLIDRYGQFELYDLENDKKELINVVNIYPEVKKELENKMLLRLLR